MRKQIWRTVTVMAAVTAGPLAVADPAAAQIGAIGGAPGAVATGAEATAGAPIFGESALVMPKGSWAAGAYAGYTSGSVQSAVASADFSFTQVMMAGFYSPVDRLTLGAMIFPYASVEVESGLGGGEESGRGDAQIYAKYQLWNSTDGRTSIAGAGSIGLPIGDDDFGAEGASFGVGGAVSHALDRISLHGSLGVAIPTDEIDGETTLNFGSALVYAALPTLSLGIELLGSTFSSDQLDDRFTSIDLAPGARLRVGDRVFLDAGILFNASTTPVESAFDYAFLVGATVTR